MSRNEDTAEAEEEEATVAPREGRVSRNEEEKEISQKEKSRAPRGACE